MSKVLTVRQKGVLTTSASLPNIIKPETNRFARCLFFGPSGQGKTSLLGTAQEDERTAPMILLDYEGGTSVLVGTDMDIVRIRDWKDYNDTYAYLLRSKHPYNSVGMDSISETHIFALLAQLDSSTRTRTVPDLLEQGDYGVALVQMRRLLRKFRDLPLHFFATCMAKDETEPREGTVKKPALAGALADEAPGIFEMVAYLAVADTEDEEGNIATLRYLLLRNQAKIRVKVRVPKGTALPEFIENPTITSVLDILGITQIPQNYQPPAPYTLEGLPEEPVEEASSAEPEPEAQEEVAEAPKEDSKPKFRGATRRVVSRSK